MKVCLICRKFDENSGSAVWIYAEKLSKKLKEKGIEVYKIEQKGSGLNSNRYHKFFHDWINIPLKCLKLYLFKGIKKFHFLSENQAMVIPLLNFLGAETIASFNDLMRTTGRKDRYFNLIYYLASKAKKVHCISSETKEDLIKKTGIDGEVKVIPINYREFNPLGRKKGEIVLGYLGALNSRKRPEKLLEIEKELILRKRMLRIDVWGRGGLFEEIKRKKKNLIKLKGFAPEDKLNKIYSSFDFLLFPSSYEGLGLPIIESAMCGVPIFIYSDAKIPPEVKDLCIICKDSKDMVKKMLELKGKGKELLKKELIKRVEKFSFDKNVEKMIRFYKLKY